MKLQYTLNGVKGLEYALALAFEIRAEMGMTPDFLELDSGEKVRFNKEDFRSLEKGAISESDYIKKHRIIQ